MQIITKKLKSIFMCEFTINKYEYESMDYLCAFSVDIYIPKYDVLIAICYCNINDDDGLSPSY